MQAQQAAQDADASPPTPAAASTDVQRYADEEGLDDATVITLKSAATARSSADTTSSVVGELKPGSKVLPIAVHGDYVLVALGSDPSSDPQGWVGGEPILAAIKAATPSAGKKAAPAKPAATAAPAKNDDLTPPAWLVLAPGETVTARDGKCFVVKRPVPVPDDTARCQPLAAPAGDFIGLPDSLDRACPVGFTQAGAYSCTRACDVDADCKGGKGCDTAQKLNGRYLCKM